MLMRPAIFYNSSSLLMIVLLISSPFPCNASLCSWTAHLYVPLIFEESRDAFLSFYAQLNKNKSSQPVFSKAHMTEPSTLVMRACLASGSEIVLGLSESTCIIQCQPRLCSYELVTPLVGFSSWSPWQLFPLPLASLGPNLDSHVSLF